MALGEGRIPLNERLEFLTRTNNTDRFLWLTLAVLKASLGGEYEIVHFSAPAPDAAFGSMRACWCLGSV